jgi:hypothetical protein
MKTLDTFIIIFVFRKTLELNFSSSVRKADGRLAINVRFANTAKVRHYVPSNGHAWLIYYNISFYSIDTLLLI